MTGQELKVMRQALDFLDHKVLLDGVKDKNIDEWDSIVNNLRQAIANCEQVDVPICYLRWNVVEDKPMWDEGCVRQNNVYNNIEDGIYGKPLYAHPPIDPKAHMSVMAVSAFEAGQHSMQDENVRLKKALMDAINKPKGVVPASAEKFYQVE